MPAFLFQSAGLRLAERAARDALSRLCGVGQTASRSGFTIECCCQVSRLLPMHPPKSPPIDAALAHRAREGADASQIAGAVAERWQRAEDALAQIIGKRGVAALYKRSLHVAARSHASLTGLHLDVHDNADPAALVSALSRESNVDAAAAGGALLQTFSELLASLVGASLAERLLRPAWADLSSAAGSKDTLP
ncbi:MAG: hypothetical protein ACXWJG_12290 [Caldimonas sp.]